MGGCAAVARRSWAAFLVLVVVSYVLWPGYGVVPRWYEALLLAAVTSSVSNTWAACWLRKINRQQDRELAVAAEAVAKYRRDRANQSSLPVPVAAAAMDAGQPPTVPIIRLPAGASMEQALFAAAWAASLRPRLPHQADGIGPVMHHRDGSVCAPGRCPWWQQTREVVALYQVGQQAPTLITGRLVPNDHALHVHPQGHCHSVPGDCAPACPRWGLG